MAMGAGVWKIVFKLEDSTLISRENTAVICA